MVGGEGRISSCEYRDDDSVGSEAECSDLQMLIMVLIQVVLEVYEKLKLIIRMIDI